MAGRKNKTRSKVHAEPAGSSRRPSADAAAEIGARGRWTATAAARTAREARIATAAHLRTAPIAQQWEITRVMSSYQLWRNHLRDQLRQEQPRLDPDSPRGAAILDETAAALLYGGSGLTPPYPTDLDDAARRLLDLRAADLEAATLYVISPSMCDVVIAAAQTLTIDDLALLNDDDLPSPTGMLLLPHPIIVRAVNGNLGDDRAYVWTSPAQLPSATETGQAVIRPGVRLTTYLDSHGPVRPNSFRDIATLAGAQHTPLPLLMPDGTRTTPYLPIITEAMRSALTDLGGHARAHADRWREINTAAGYAEGDQVDDSFEYRPGEEINDHDDLFSIRFLYAFWRLCNQGIAHLDHIPAGHNARLLAERAGVSPDVRVTTIRPDTRTTDRPATARDWQHRWVVRMHKVRQWYPSEQRHRVLYRGPYIKGPADKPLLGGEIVRGLR
jgi:hypothetical protein